MLDQLFNIVKHFGQQSVVDNPDVPNDRNQEVMADATKTIAGGFQNVLAGGGFGNLLNLFRGGKQNSQSGTGGVGGLLKSPIVSMMIGYFISKLVSKYKMSPPAASNVANDLIPKSINKLVEQTNDPNDSKATLDNLVGSLTGGSAVATDSTNSDTPLQDILDKDGDGIDDNQQHSGGFNLKDIISNLAQKVQHSFQDQQQNGKPGLMDMIKGLI